MQKKIILAAALAAIFVIAPVAAQGPANAPPPTNVSGTILDPTGVPYNTGFIRFDLVPAGGPVPCVGTPCTSINGHYGNVYLDGNGHFQMNLYPNSLITPAATQWQITVSEPGNPAPWCFGPQSFTTAITVTNTATMDVSATLSALAPQLCRNGGSSSSSIKIEHNGVLVGTEPAVNIVDTGTVVATVTDNPGLTRVDVSNAASSGTGCTIGTLLDQWVMSIHPNATCYGSLDWLWDDTLFNNTQGDGSNALSLTNTLAFTQGTGNHQTDVSRSWAIGNGNTHTCDANTIGTANCHDFFDTGRANTITDTGASSSSFFDFIFGESNTITVTGGSTGSDLLQLLRGNTMQALTGGDVDNSGQIGKNNTIQASGASSITSSTFQMGEVNSATTSAGGNVEDNIQLGETNSLQATAATSVVGFVAQLGFNNSFFTSTGGVQVNYGFAVGHANNNSDGSGATTNMTDFGMVGHSIHLVNCSDCFAMGKNIDQTTSNTLFLGMSATPAVVISNNGGSHDNFKLSPLAFASLPACAGGTEGSLMPVTDSTTVTWGATITGGSTNHVLAYCDGTNWTVAAK